MGPGECSALPPSLEPTRLYRKLAEVTDAAIAAKDRQQKQQTVDAEITLS
jgi:hypothetical protein